MAQVRASSTRDVSPDSVILTFESNFSSLFSSTSASVDRCSFASDTQDHDSLSSHIFQHLSGHGGGSCSGGGPDLNVAYSNKPPSLNLCTNRHVSSKVDKAKVHREENNKVILVHNHRHNNNNGDDNNDEIEALDSARSSFSQALKECQERRSRSEALVTKKLDRRRPASFDLNNATLASNVVSSSPKFGVMNNKSLHTARKSGNFPSTGTPNYRNGGVGITKGWCSERVPLHSNGSHRRQIGAALLPLNSNNGRGLPSKWEDAERWIFSPVSGDGGGRVSSSSSSTYQQPLRRPKSKSGPLGSPGVAYHSMYSPAAPMYEGGNFGIRTAGSPFSAGVMLADVWSFRVSSEGKGFSDNLEPCIARSVSVHGCTDLVCQDDGVDDAKDAATIVSRSVSRRDMATQMSPGGSCQSSPRQSSFSQSTTPSKLPIVELQSFSSSKPEVRDVQIDERVTVTRWSKKYRGRNPSKGSEDVDEWKLKTVEPRSSAWEVSETVKSLSNFLNRARRDEAKIATWENLQKAKAEAAIRKLEMKLEKKRSSSMDKILKKLRSAQKKAQEMRSTILTNQALQVSKTSNNPMSLRTRQMGSLSGCFTCHAF